jgi:predicted transcriptional regulator YdeE
LKKVQIEHPPILLIGITARTNNTAEKESATAKILPTVIRYYQEKLFSIIPCRKMPGTTYCAYTEYEGDCTGDYTYFIGEEVTSHDLIPEGMQALTIPKQQYAKFTTEPGSMPEVCITAWQAIWKMSDDALGGSRRYHTDFELYDERANDPHNLVLDLYIGIK